MSNQGASRGARQQSNSESGPPRFNITSFDDELFAENADLSLNRNSLCHQSQQIIPGDLPEGFNESPMWVGSRTRLQVRKLSASSEQQAFIESKLEIILKILPLGRGILMRSLLHLRGLILVGIHSFSLSGSVIYPSD